MNRLTALSKLFGSNSRAAILRLLLNNSKSTFRVNEVSKKAAVNPRLASLELRKLMQIGILTSRSSGNALLYQIDSTSPYVKPLKTIFSQHDWLVWERPSRIHHLLITLEAGLKPMKSYYGHCLPYAHLVFDYDNVSWFFKMSQFQALGKKLIPIYQKRQQKIWHDFNHFASKLEHQKTYSSFHNHYLKFWKVAWITEPISFYIDSLLKPTEHISIANQSFTDEYENAIWRLAKKAKRIGIDKLDVKPIIDRYFWIRNSYHSVHHLTQEEVKTEISKKLNKTKSKTKKTTDPTSISSHLLQIGKDMVLMQDKRKEIMMRAAYYLHQHLKSVGKKHKLTPSMMTQSLASEALRLPKNITQFKKNLKLRQLSCTITGSLGQGIQVYARQTFFPKGAHIKTSLEIRGKAACGGKAVGRAKIISRLDSLPRVNHGDVIVSPMTSPDFMSAIRRCVAIVTDFGGITCHAAIVSREFNIPCVIGTKNATEKISDGDLVEVNADNGIVKVIQKKE